MKKLYKRLIAISLALSVTSVSIWLYFFYNPLFLVDFPAKKSFYWFSPWNNASYERLVESYEEIDMISPSWWRVLPNGTMTDEHWYLDVSPVEVFDFCRSKDIEIHPLVSNYDDHFNPNLISEIINNQTSVSNFIDSSKNLLQLYNCSGINLDFEGVPSQDREIFTLFLQEVKDELGDDYTISIDIPAKSADWSFGWSGAFDYEAVGEICDYVMIMTYDHSWSTSSPGQIAPISWVRTTLEFAKKEIPNEKIYCGIPLYGYNWPNTGEPASSGGFSYFSDLLSQYDVKVKRYWDSKELYFEYTDTYGTSWQAVFPDVTTRIKKESFINKYPIGGYCYWYLGIGDPAYWE